jgi:hypothetical protein
LLGKPCYRKVFLIFTQLCLDCLPEALQPVHEAAPHRTGKTAAA